MIENYNIRTMKNKTIMRATMAACVATLFSVDQGTLICS